jgi:hypothetical protein
MTISYQEVLDCGSDVWDKFCKKYGVSEWAVNEGGGDCTESMTISEAYHLGIIRHVTDWKLEPKETK